MRPNAIFFLSTAATSMSVLFIPVIAQNMGASNLMIGLIVSMYGFMSLLSMYFFGWVSDEKGRLALIRAGMLFAAFAFLMQSFADTEAKLLAARSLCGLSIGVFYSSLVMYGVEAGKKLGKFTSYESLGWGAGNLVAGLMIGASLFGLVAGYADIFTVSALVFFACFILSMRLRDVKAARIRSPLLPIGLIRKNANIYFPFLLRDIGAFCAWTFFPLYLIDLGANDMWIGILIFLNSGLQFPMKQIVDRYDFEKLFTWGLAISAVALYAYVLPRNYIEVIPVQLLIAIAWTTLSVGAMGLLTQRNQEKATVIGLFSSTRGVAQIIAPLVGGVIAEYWGYKALMFFSGSITTLGLAFHLSLKERRIKSQRV
ncbi:MAG: MFS transporter [Candidatus Altiarchaeota archaeon]